MKFLSLLVLMKNIEPIFDGSMIVIKDKPLSQKYAIFHRYK